MPLPLVISQLPPQSILSPTLQASLYVSVQDSFQAEPCIHSLLPQPSIFYDKSLKTFHFYIHKKYLQFVTEQSGQSMDLADTDSLCQVLGTQDAQAQASPP